MCRWPLLLPFLMMALGLSLTALFGFPVAISSLFSLLVCLLLASFHSGSTPFTVCTALFFLWWGLSALNPWLFPVQNSHSIHQRATGLRSTIEGVISERPEVTEYGSRMVIQAEHIQTATGVEAVTGHVLLFISDGDIQLERGDRIRFISGISTPRLLGLPGEFNYPRFLAFQGIGALCRVQSPRDVVLIKGGAVISFQRSIDHLALVLGENIRHAIPDESTSSVLTALLLGDQRRIPHDLAAAYTRAGVNHILSISGFHVGIIATCISLLTMWCLSRSEYISVRWNIRKIAVLVSVPTMAGYLMLTGSAPATARSVLMLMVFALALYAEREQDAINTLLLAAFVLVAANPPTLFDISFQLSFVSLWGIMLIVPPISRWCERLASLRLRTLILFVAASVAATAVTVLPVLHTFNVASMNGILTNFLIVPLLGYGAVLAGFVAAPVTLLVPWAAPCLLWPAAVMVQISNRFILWCISLPVYNGYFVTTGDMLFFWLLLVWLTFVSRPVVLRSGALLLVVAGCAVHFIQASVGDRLLHITMLSVGQAESLLLRLPDKSTLLVDGGGYLFENDNDFGQKYLAPALGALHVTRVDRMVATHEHPDHSGGLPFIIKNFPVGEFWSVRRVTAEIDEALQQKRLPRHTLTVGEIIELPGPVTITVLSPAISPSTGGDSEDNVNEQSLVFRLVYGQFSMLFTADAGFEAELAMCAEKGLLESTILKVGHHGSRYSTSEKFLDRVHPKTALISAGAGNRFGLPSTRTVDLLMKRRIPLYRTDRDGTIEVVTDGTTWSVTTPYKPD